MSATSAFAPAVSRALKLLRADLEQVFTTRLVSLVLYGRHVPDGVGPAASGGAAWPSDASTRHADAPDAAIYTLALVSSLTYADLAACAGRVDTWERAGLAMPLLLSPAEFASSLDVFPLEYGAIIARHLAIVGNDPFQGIVVHREDVRRACEVQAKSHLIHLREGFLQAGGHGARVARLIAHSIDSFHTLLVHVAQLDRADSASVAALARHAEARVGLSAALVTRLLTLADREPLTTDEAMQWYPPYLEASERLARFVDGWKEPARA